MRCAVRVLLWLNVHRSCPVVWHAPGPAVGRGLPCVERAGRPEKAGRPLGVMGAPQTDILKHHARTDREGGTAHHLHTDLGNVRTSRNFPEEDWKS